MIPVHAPRINNNDDTVTVVRVAVNVGDFVRSGELILEVETEKAAVTVEAEQDGYILAVFCREGDTIAVGSIAMVLGDHADEAVPESAPPPPGATAGEDDGITGKARLLLARHGLSAAVVPRQSGGRLTAADIEAFLAGGPSAVPPAADRPVSGGLPAAPPAAGGSVSGGPPAASPSVDRSVAVGPPAASPSVDRPISGGPPAAPPATGKSVPGGPPAASPDVDLPDAGDISPLRPSERATLATVSWQRDHAAAAWLEIEYDPQPWRDRGAAMARDLRLLLDPTLALMAHRLALLAAATGANGTILEDGAPRRVRYRHVNLGFTVQAHNTLWLCVVRAAETMQPADFVGRLQQLQRRAMANRLEPSEMRGATAGFTSMARWAVRRHMPLLVPWSALMVAHGDAYDDGTRAVLGVTYDHRLLSGFDAARLLRLLADPTAPIPTKGI